jgi:hypothetical protein
MAGYKVRLDDGSEIGPMDLTAVRSWYSDGLLNPESLVLAPGSRRWVRLRQAVDIKSWGGTALRAGGRGRQGSAPEDEETWAPAGDGEPFVERIRAPLSGILLVACAALCGLWAFFPTYRKAALNDWPWMEISLGLLAAGLCLFVRPRVTRVLVFVVLLLAALATLTMVGVLVVQKAPLTAYLVLGGGLLALLGFLAMLEGRTTSWPRTILGTLAVLAGGGGACWAGFVPSDDAESLVRQWAAPESELTNTQLGITLRLPATWRLVKPGAPFLPAPEGALARLARTDATAYAYLTAESAPRGMVELEPLAERALAMRQQSVPSLRALERTSSEIGGLPARTVLAESGDAHAPTRELVTVWRNGFMVYTLAAWGKAETCAALAARLGDLTSGFKSLGGSSQRLAEAVAKATAEVPFLSPLMAERIMSMSEAGVLEPPEAFKRALALGGQGIPSLSPSDVLELQGILEQAYRTLSKADRKRLADYLGQVRGRGTTEPGLDQTMCTLMGQALGQLPGTSRQRLQALYDEAIAAALNDPTTAPLN